MKKKLLSLVCACTLVFSTMASMIVAEAAPNVTYELNFENTNQTLDDSFDANWEYDSLHGIAPVYKATLTVKGSAAKTPVRDESNQIIAFTGALMNGIQAAIRYESSQELVMISSTPLAGGSSGTDIADSKVLTMSWGTSTASAYLKADTVACTWYLFAKDGSDITDIKLYKDANSTQKVEFAEFYDGTSKTAQKKVPVTDINFINYPAAPTTYAVTTAATENGTVAVDKETASEGETVTITTTPSEGYEVATVTAGDAVVTGADNTYTFTMPAKAVDVVVTFKAKTVVDTNAAEKLGNYAEGANDNAVAFKKTFDANSLTGKTLMKLTAIVDGVARVYKGAPVAIPNVDGELKLGVVIQYKDADVNVESLAIELQ